MKTTILIRLAVGLIFLSEGIQKFLYPDTIGGGRFMSIGIPFPEVMAPLVGSFEIICGLLVTIGLAVRWATIPLLVVITTAIITTKIPIFIKSGFFKMAHEARTDYAMLLSLIFLLFVGAGAYSLDAVIWKKNKRTKP